MAHPGRTQRRAAKKAERKARQAEKARARGRGRDSGDFSETGFTAADRRPSLGKRIQIAAQGVLDEGKKRRLRESRFGAPTPFQKFKETGKQILKDPPPIGPIGIFGRASLLGSIFRAGKVLGPAAVVAGARRAGGATIPAALGAGAGVLLERQLAGRGQQMPHRDAGKARGLLPGVGGSLPSKDTVVKVWTTGTANFARLLDGRIAVQKKDGTIKTYRPQKHIVIPRNPRVGTLIRADKRLERLTKGLRKVVRTGKR